MARWKCQRVTAGVKCGFTNEATKRICYGCGKHRPPKRKPKHMAALEQPYEVFLRLNGGLERCGICGAEPGQRKLHRDHDHRTGLPRGLCCFRCNSALRPYMTLEWLRDAVAYLERAQSAQVIADLEIVAAAARTPAPRSEAA